MGKSVSKTIKNEAKEQKGAFPSMLFGSWGTSLGNLLTGKEVKTKIAGGGVVRSGEGMIRVGQDF